MKKHKRTGSFLEKLKNKIDHKLEKHTESQKDDCRSRIVTTREKITQLSKSISFYKHQNYVIENKLLYSKSKLNRIGDKYAHQGQLERIQSQEYKQYKIKKKIYKYENDLNTKKNELFELQKHLNTLCGKNGDQIS